MGGGGPNKIRRHFLKMPVKLFSSEFLVSQFLVLSLSRSRRGPVSERRKDVMGRRVFGKVLGKCLSRLETLRATPPPIFTT